MKGNARRRLRADGQDIEPTAFVGRRGLDGNVLEEIDQQLKRRKLIKVRFRGSASGGDRDVERVLAQDLAGALGAELMEHRGHTVLLYRERAPKTGREGR